LPSRNYSSIRYFPDVGRRSGRPGHEGRQSKTLAQDGAETGQVILDEAASFGADLIIKGAYTHSRLRQMIFGGATKHLLAAAPIPVLMAH